MQARRPLGHEKRKTKVDKKRVRPIESLPDEILAVVFSFVPCIDMSSNVSRVSKRWRCVASDLGAVGQMRCVGPTVDRSLWCRTAAHAAHIRCLQRLRAMGHAWDASTCAEAAWTGRLDVLRYLYESGCPWDEYVCRAAAAQGHVHCLRYAHENGCPLSIATFCVITWRGKSLDCLRYLYDHDCPRARPPFETCRDIAAGGNVAMMRYARDQGQQWDAYACVLAASNGHLDMLCYMHEHGCPWDERTTLAAERYGEPGCLRYALEHGCPVHECTMACTVDIHLQHAYDQGY